MLLQTRLSVGNLGLQYIDNRTNFLALKSGPFSIVRLRTNLATPKDVLREAKDMELLLGTKNENQDCSKLSDQFPN